MGKENQFAKKREIKKFFSVALGGHVYSAINVLLNMKYQIKLVVNAFISKIHRIVTT